MNLLSTSSRLLVAGGIALVMALAGCSSSKSRVGGVFNLDTDLRLTLLTATDSNPDQRGRPSPVIVRLYELNGAATFDKADFIDLFEQDEKLLGRELLGKKTFDPLAPGEQREQGLVLTEGTTHVGLYAEFSQYRGSAYKVVFPVTQNNVIRNAVKVRIEGNQLSLAE